MAIQLSRPAGLPSAMLSYAPHAEKLGHGLLDIRMSNGSVIQFPVKGTLYVEPLIGVKFPAVYMIYSEKSER